MGWFKRREPAVSDPRNAVYAWKSWSGYYVKDVVPRALQVRARPTDNPALVVSMLPSSVRRFLFHIDLTESATFPLERQRLRDLLLARGITLINERVRDLRKSTIQKVLHQLNLPSTMVRREGAPGELLIVKTNRNYGGYGERILGWRYRRMLGVRQHSSPVRNSFDYRVLPRAEIPAGWWSHPALFIERFISNRERRIVRVRIALENYAFWSGVSAELVKKTFHCNNTTEHFLHRGDYHCDLPRSLQETVYRFAESFSFEYGALDLIGDDEGRYYVIDANSTPGRGSWVPERMEFLSNAWNTNGQVAERHAERTRTLL